jgi:uncharacterized protein
MEKPLSEKERSFLLKLARAQIEAAVNDKKTPEIQRQDLAPALTAIGASFVTLTIHGNLRGCIGSLEAHQPLFEDVMEHAVQAALEDYRFPPLNQSELNTVKIEISRLTVPQPVSYNSPLEILEVINPPHDGVILKDGFRRSTFLPQVWEQLPDPEEFLSHLCAKMGASADLWKRKILEVSIYKVEEFEEA